MIKQVIVWEFNDPILMHLDKVDAIEVFTKEHRPQLNDWEYHIVVNGQDTLKYTYDTKAKSLYMLTKDNDTTDKYNDEALEYLENAQKLIKDRKASQMKKEEQLKELWEHMHEKYPQTSFIRKCNVVFTYWDWKNLLDHPTLSNLK